MCRRLALLLLLLAACRPEATLVTPAPLIQLIGFWETVTGSLSAGERQGWTFSGQAGDNIRLRLTAQDGMITLQDAGGAVLASGADVQAELPTGGVYTALVEGTGDYRLELSYTDRRDPSLPTETPAPPTATPSPTPTPPYYARLGDFQDEIASGRTLAGTFTGSEPHVYTFEGRAGQYAAIRLSRSSGTVDPVLTLYGPDGIALAADDNSGENQSAVLRNIRLPDNGRYAIQAQGKGQRGEYQITLLFSLQPVPVTPTVIVQPTATPFFEVLTPTVAAATSGDRLADHVPVIGSIERPGDFDRYSLLAASGEVLTIGVSPAGSGLRPRLEVYDPAGLLVGTATWLNSNADGDALIPLLRADQTGPYGLFITAEDGTTGNYIVSYGVGASRETVRRGPTAVDQTYTNRITRRGFRDEWSLFLNAGDVISAAASPLNSGLDPVLELAAPDGSAVASDDNSGGGVNALIGSALAPVSGVYHLRVSDARAASGGQYTLVWHYVNLAATPTPPPGTILLLSFEDVALDNVYRFYPFQGRAGQRVQVNVIAHPGSNLDPVAALLGPDGAVVADGDDSPGDLNPRFLATLPADGTYQVRVNGYLSSGPFELTVQQVVD